MNRLGPIGAFLLLSAAASAAPPETRWYWYQADLSGSQYTHEPKISVDTRKGFATVRISKSSITIVFDEPAYPEVRPKFTGRIARNGAIVGDLPDFFGGDAPGPGRLQGQYRRLDQPNCWIEDIHLQDTFPSTDVWVLFRAHGDCMKSDDDEPSMGR